MSRMIVVVIATACLFSFLSMGLRQGFGLFMVPMTDALGIGRSDFSLAIGLQNLLWGLLAPVFGSYADRHGFVRVAVVGGLLYGCGLITMSCSGGVFGLLLGQVMVGVALAASGLSMMLGLAGKAVAQRQAPIVLGVVSAVASFGQFAMIPPTQFGIDFVGWRDTLLWLAVAVTPIIFLASQLALPPQSSRVVAAANPATQVLRCALTNNSYLFLALAFFVCGFQIVFIATHLPAYLTSVGHSPQVAAWALSLIGIFNIAGSLICGWLGSRYSKRIILVWLYLVRSLVIALFILVPQSAVTVLLFGSTIGLLWLGTVPLTSSLVINFFGLRHMTMLCGVVFLMHQVGSFCGSWVGGLIYEASGSYDIMWWLCVALGVLAAALHLPIRERADQVFASRYA